MTDSDSRPDSDQSTIVAIDSLRRSYEAAQRERNEHDRKILCWTKANGFGVWVYTILTFVVVMVAFFAWRTNVDNEKRSLRAYISHEPGGMAWGKKELSESLVYFEYNFGLTPARDVKMYVCIKKGIKAPPNFVVTKPDCHRLSVMNYVAPKQNIGQIVAHWEKTDPFFLYGYVDYNDVFGGQWRRRFAWNYDPMRVAAGFDKFVAHDTHNDEIECKNWKCDP